MYKLKRSRAFKIILYLLMTISFFSMAIAAYVLGEYKGLYYTEEEYGYNDFEKTRIFTDTYANVIETLTIVAEVSQKYNVANVYDIEDYVSYTSDAGDVYEYEDICKVLIESGVNNSATIEIDKDTYVSILTGKMMSLLEKKFGSLGEERSTVYDRMYSSIEDVVYRSDIKRDTYEMFSENYELNDMIYYDWTHIEDAFSISQINENEFIETCISALEDGYTNSYKDVLTEDEIYEMEALYEEYEQYQDAYEFINSDPNFRYYIILNKDLILSNVQNYEEVMEYYAVQACDDASLKNPNAVVVTAVTAFDEMIEELIKDGSTITAYTSINYKDVTCNLMNDAYLLYGSGKTAVTTLYVCIFISAAVFVLSIIFITICAGYKKGCEKPVRIWADKLPLEFFAIIFLFVLIGFNQTGLAYAMNMHNSINWIERISSGEIIFMYLSIVVIIASLMSIKRRVISTGIQKNDSFVYKMVKCLKSLIYDRFIIGKVVIVFLGIVVLYIAGFAFGYIIGREFGVIFMITLISVLLIIAVSSVLSEYDALINYADGVTRGQIRVDIDLKKYHGFNKIMADKINNLEDGMANAIEEKMKSERMKTDLITNVSHDIKTPLTSIINYVDLIKKEDTDNENIKSYAEILDNKSQRLKALIEDLIEASKLSSGVVEIRKDKINFTELIKQTNGEFEEKFATKNLTLICDLPEDKIFINGDGKRIYRVLDNIYNNAYKYSLENTRIYASVKVDSENVKFEFKNISEQELNLDAEELKERFVRGDKSRNTEGSGLGLSIANNIVELHSGKMDIIPDGDLFKVIITLPLFV